MTKKTTLWQWLKNAFTNAEASANQTKQSSDLDNQPFAQDLTGQVIVDLTQQDTENTTVENSPNFDTNTASSSDRVTADDLDVMLASMGYHFTYHPPKSNTQSTENPENTNALHHFTMQVSDGERDWGCLLRFFEKEQLLAVYSIFAFSVPDSHRGEMAVVLTYLNYDLVIGNLELDVHDGEVRFKTSLDLEVTGLSEMVLAYLLQSNFSVTSRLHDTLAEVIAKPEPAQTASEAVESLLSAQQEKTFYLLTETLQ